MSNKANKIQKIHTLSERGTEIDKEQAGRKQMKRISKIGLMVGTFAAAMPVAQEEAQAETPVSAHLIQGADRNGDLAPTRIRNGVEVLRPRDEEYTPEQASLAFSKVDPTRGVFTMMATQRLDGPNGPNTGDRIERGPMQGACMPFQLVQDAASPSGVGVIPDVANFKYITQRNSNEGRAYNIPEIKEFTGVDANGQPVARYAIFANWQEAGANNTEESVQVVDDQCNLMTLTSNSVETQENNTSAVVMKKNNDNCSGHQAEQGTDVTQEGTGIAHFYGAELCNGNGRDDGWLNYTTIECTGNTCNVEKINDVSYITQEERSRGNCEDMGGGLQVCCGTEGNSQPQREGVWCAGIDAANDDLLWKEQVAYRENFEGRRAYAMRIKMLADLDAAGNKTGNITLQYQMHRGNNNNDRKGGYDEQIVFRSATPTRDGLGLGPVQDVTIPMLGYEMTHATLCQTFTGPPSAPVLSYMMIAPNLNEGGDKPSHGALFPKLADGSFGELKDVGLVKEIASHKYSKYLGNNPNNQGRNYTPCKTIDHPFKNDGSKLLMIGSIGKSDSAGAPAIKPDLHLLIKEVTDTPETPENPNTPDEPTEENPDGTDEENPETPDTPDNGEDGTDNGQTGFDNKGGCSTGGTSGGLAGLFFGLALVAIRRRRSL